MFIVCFNVTLHYKCSCLLCALSHVIVVTYVPIFTGSCWVIVFIVVSACQYHLVISGVLSLVFFVLLAFLALKFSLLHNFTLCLYSSPSAQYTALSCAVVLARLPIPFLLSPSFLSQFFFYTFFLLLFLILLLPACSFPSPPNLNRGAMPSPGWHTVKHQLQPSASPAQSTATPLGMR